MFRYEAAADQLLARPCPDMDVLDTELLIEMSDFHEGERKEPLATATAGVPLPALRTLSFCGRSGDRFGDTPVELARLDALSA